MSDDRVYKCMELSTTVLRYIGTWPRWNEMAKPSERVYLLYTGFVVAVMTVYVAILTYGLVDDAEWRSSLDTAIEDIIVYATGVIVLMKILLLVFNQDRLQEVIDYINGNLNRRQILTRNDRKEILSCVKHEKVVVQLYVGSAGFIIILYTASSLVKMMRGRSNDTYDASLPLKYPFRIMHSGAFILAYAHQFIIMVVNGVVGTLADAFFSCLVYYICGHLVLVKKRFMAQGPFVEKSCVRYHTEVLGLIQRVESIFQKFLLFMFSVNSILICLGLLQITQVDNIKPMYYAKCCVYLMIKLSQLFLYCWYGQEIIQRSSDIGFGCYSTDWYAHLDRRTDFRDLIFVLQRTQKPVEMRAGSFFSISISTLKSVINTSYSYFTMLSSFRK